MRTSCTMTRIHLPQLRVLDNPLHLRLHTRHRVLPPPRSSMSRNAHTHTGTVTELEHRFLAGRSSTHTRSDEGAVDLSVKVFGVWVLGDELGNLDAGDEVLVRLRHEFVVPCLQCRWYLLVTSGEPATARLPATYHLRDLRSFPATLLLCLFSLQYLACSFHRHSSIPIERHDHGGVVVQNVLERMTGEIVLLLREPMTSDRHNGSVTQSRGISFQPSCAKRLRQAAVWRETRPIHQVRAMLLLLLPDVLLLLLNPW